MGCNCGKKNKAQKIQNQVQAAQARKVATNKTPGRIPVSDHVKAMNNLRKK